MIMTKAKKSRKMDPKLVAAKQMDEIYYIASRHKIPAKKVRAAVAQAGRRRARVYELLRSWGYTIITRLHTIG